MGVARSHERYYGYPYATRTSFTISNATPAFLPHQTARFIRRGPRVDKKRPPVIRADLGSIIRRAASVLRRIVGVPDYERYVAHVRDRHPGTVAMSREEFERLRLEDKYSRPGQRCC